MLDKNPGNTSPPLAAWTDLELFFLSNSGICWIACRLHFFVRSTPGVLNVLFSHLFIMENQSVEKRQKYSLSSVTTWSSICQENAKHFATKEPSWKKNRRKLEGIAGFYFYFIFYWCTNLGKSVYFRLGMSWVVRNGAGGARLLTRRQMRHRHKSRWQWVCNAMVLWSSVVHKPHHAQSPPPKLQV